MKKRLLSIICICAMLLVSFGAAVGTDEPDLAPAPYEASPEELVPTEGYVPSAHSRGFSASELREISTAQELISFADEVNGGAYSLNALLTASVDLQGVAFTPIGFSDYYTGTFDGADFTISGISVNGQGNSYTGLFGYMSGTVKDLNLSGFVAAQYAGGVVGLNAGTISNVVSNVAVLGGLNTGGIASENRGEIQSCVNQGYVRAGIGGILGGIAGLNSGTIEFCTNSGFIQGDFLRKQQGYALTTGGIAGKSMATGVVISCTNKASISGGNFVGGIVGRSAGSITSCVNVASLYCYDKYAGGILALSESGSTAEISLCKNYGNIYGRSFLGGIAASSAVLITNCENYGSIPEGTGSLGGIVATTTAPVENSLNNGTVAGTGYYIGGIAGSSQSSISSCHNFGSITGEYCVGGIVSISKAKISLCSNNAAVTGLRSTGGITGESQAEISKCANLGDVTGNIGSTGNYAGGIVGSASAASNIYDCYNSGAVTGLWNYAQLVGRGYGGAIKNCVSYSTLAMYTSSTPTTNIANNYNLANKTEQDFSSGSVVTLLDTENNTVAARNVWTLNNNLPALVALSSPVLTPTCAILPRAETENTIRDFYGAVITAADNAGVSYDVHPMIFGGMAYFVLPSSADKSTIVYYTLDNTGVAAQAPVTLDATDGLTHLLNANGYPLVIRVMQSALPTMYVDIDEANGSIYAMNSSGDHSIKCFGDFRLDVPSALATEKGWNTSYTSVEGKDTPGTMEIKGRGNSTWNISPGVQKPYQMKSDKKVDLLGKGSARTWLLIMAGESVIRNKLGLDLAQDMGISYTPDSEFIEVFMNGEYAGMYLLTEKVEVDKKRIPISDIDDELDPLVPISDMDLTGGYLIELDNNTDPMQYTIRVDSNPITITVKSPEELDTAPTATNNYSYIYNYTSDLINAITNDGLMPDGRSYLEYIDIESFARYYWHQEFATNTDCGRGSTYFYKDKDSIDPLLHAGPVWDSDCCFHDVNINTWRVAELNQRDNIPNTPRLYNLLMQRRDFVSYVMWYYEKLGLRDILANAGSHVTEYERTIYTATEQNRIKWRQATNDNSVISIKNYLPARMNWIDDNYATLRTRATKGEFVNVAAALGDAISATVGESAINVTVANATGSELSGSVICAVYNANQLVSTQIHTLSPIANNQDDMFTFDTCNDTYDTIKLILVDDLSHLKPLCNPCVILND